MRSSRQFRRLIIFVVFYLAFCVTAGILLCDGSLRPARRPLTNDEEMSARQLAADLDSNLSNAIISGRDGIPLRAWSIRPSRANDDAVILLHGLADNRFGMIGYARMFLRHGYRVLLPDARAHGASGGAFATYGLLERDDIHGWFDWLNAEVHPRCIFGFGESMGAAQLLQALQRTQFCAVAAESPFSDFAEIAYDRMGQPFHVGPWFGRTFLWPVVETAFLRAEWKYKFNMREVSPEKIVSLSGVPVLLIHGQIDSNIPVRHSRRIHALDAKAVLWEVPRADHCGAISVAPEEFDRRVIEWFVSHSGRANGATRTSVDPSLRHGQALKGVNPRTQRGAKAPLFHSTASVGVSRRVSLHALSSVSGG